MCVYVCVLYLILYSNHKRRCQSGDSNAKSCCQHKPSLSLPGSGKDREWGGARKESIEVIVTSVALRFGRGSAANGVYLVATTWFEETLTSGGGIRKIEWMPTDWERFLIDIIAEVFFLLSVCKTFKSSAIMGIVYKNKQLVIIFKPCSVSISVHLKALCTSNALEGLLTAFIAWFCLKFPISIALTFDWMTQQ